MVSCFHVGLLRCGDRPPLNPLYRNHRIPKGGNCGELTKPSTGQCVFSDKRKVACAMEFLHRLESLQGAPSIARAGTGTGRPSRITLRSNRKELASRT